MKEKVLLLTKDAMCKSYLSVYGNKHWNMPNLEVLAKKGTVFNRFYAAAPSTAMSFISMFMRKNPYETEHKKYVEVTAQEKNTVFDELYENGYESHIIWDEKWIYMAKRFSQCYGEHTKFHLVNINQTVGAHNLYGEAIVNDDDKAKNTLKIIEKAIENVVCSSGDKLFLWIHLPHVLQGRNCYGSDMDMFDEVIGISRKYFGDDSIFISADHGNMNGVKNKICYGFDVYESAINMPLITPRINNMEYCNAPISNVDIFSLINGEIPEKEFVYSDCAYYAQPHRKLAIISEKYKYIYNKKTKTEELYDLEFDPDEHCNIVASVVFDVDRKVKTPLNQVYYYPHWDEAQLALSKLRAEKDRIWREEGFCAKIKEYLLSKARVVYTRLEQRKTRQK